MVYKGSTAHDLRRNMSIIYRGVRYLCTHSASLRMKENIYALHVFIAQFVAESRKVYLVPSAESYRSMHYDLRTNCTRYGKLEMSASRQDGFHVMFERPSNAPFKPRNMHTGHAIGWRKANISVDTFSHQLWVSSQSAHASAQSAIRGRVKRVPYLSHHGVYAVSNTSKQMQKARQQQELIDRGWQVMSLCESI